MPDNSANNKRIAKNTMFLYIRMIVVMVISLYTTRVVLRVLGQEDFGIYNVVCGFVLLFSILNTSLTTGTNRFYNYALGRGDNDGVTKVFNAAMRIQFIVVAVLLFLMETVGLWYLNEKMVIPEERMWVANVIFQFSVFSLVLVILQIPYSSAVMAHEKMDYFALVSIIDVLLKLVFVIILQYIPWDRLFFYAFLTSITSLVNFAMYYVYCKRHFSTLSFCRTIDKKLFKDLLSFSGWSLLDPFTRTIQSQGSNLILNFFFGPLVNAAYGIANQVSAAVDSFTQNIAIAFRPQIIQSYSCQEDARVRNLMFSMSKVNFMLHVVMVIPLMIELKLVLTFWLGEDFPDFTVPFTSLILIARTIDCLHAPISLVMVASGKIKRVKTASAFVICSIVPISIALFHFGFAPTVIFIMMIVLAFLNLAVSAAIMCYEIPYLHVKDYIKGVMQPCALFAICTAIIPVLVSLFLEASILRLAVLIAVTILSALFTAYYVTLSQQETRLAKSMIHKFINRKK